MTSMISGRAIVALLVTLTLLFTAIFALQKQIDRSIGEYHQTEEVLYLPSGSLIKKLSMGFESLVADVYWIRAVQYYGGGRLHDPTRRFDLLEPLLDITTTLDPHLIPAYQFGAVFLSEPWPIGAQEPFKGIRLIEKGLAHNPDRWDLYRDLGFIYYWHLKDYKKAGEIFLKGSEHPSAQPWMRTLAAFTLARGGDRSTSRFLWQQLYQSAENRRAKENALGHLLALQAEEEIETLQKILNDFRFYENRLPESWEEMIRRGYLRVVPKDPSGVPYLFDLQTGEVLVSAETQLPILPTFD